MKMILAATSVFALAGCAKEDYSDPTAFAEKYLREAVLYHAGIQKSMRNYLCSVKWLFRDVMRPRLDSRLISAESALRSTQR